MESTTLNNVACGQASELFAREFKKVLENIADENMPAIAARKIVLEFTFKPSNDVRNEIVTTIMARSKLCEHAGAVGLVYAVNDDGGLRATNINPRQLTLADQLKKAKGGE